MNILGAPSCLVFQIVGTTEEVSLFIANILYTGIMKYRYGKKSKRRIRFGSHPVRITPN